METMDLEEFVTREELAKALGVNQEHLMRWRAWELPYIRCGRKVCFHRRAVADWLKSGERTANGQEG